MLEAIHLAIIKAATMWHGDQTIYNPSVITRLIIRLQKPHSYAKPVKIPVASSCSVPIASKTMTR